MEPNQEEWSDEDSVVMLIAGEEGGKEEHVHVEAAQKAPAVGKEGEKDEDQLGGGHISDGTPVRKDEGKQEESGPNSSDQEPEKPQEMPIPEDLQNLQHVSQPSPSSHPVNRRPRFTQYQVEEMERLFQVEPYPRLRARKDLARWMGVTEAEVKEWFKKRRATCRSANRVSGQYSSPSSQNPFP